MFDLNDLNGYEFITLANIISIAIAQNLTTDELAILGSFFNIIGDSLSALSITNLNNFSELKGTDVPNKNVPNSSL